MSEKFKQITIIFLIIYICCCNYCECATRKRGPPAVVQALKREPATKLTSDEIDPNVSPQLSNKNKNKNKPTVAVTEIINNANEQQQQQPSTLNADGIDSSSGNVANNIDLTTLVPQIEINANNTVLDPVDGLTSTSSSASSASSPASSSSSAASSSSSSSSSSSASLPTNVDDPNPINKFCKCTDTSCNCCRDFSLPLVPVRGPGCARIQYLGNERMSVQIKYGDIVLAQRTINGKKAPPVCVGLPGGYTKFCARVYGLSKEKAGFKSCLSLELRAEDELEAQLRVSCFRFSNKGLSVTEAEPVPQIETEKDDEDDDDIFGLGGGDDEDDGDGDGDDYDEDDEDDDDSDVANDDTDYDFRFLDVFGSAEKTKTTKNKSKITIEPNNIADPAEFKDVSGAGQDLKETKKKTKVKKPIKSKTKNNKKKKNSEDEYESISDIFFAVLSNIFY